MSEQGGEKPIGAGPTADPSSPEFVTAQASPASDSSDDSPRGAGEQIGYLLSLPERAVRSGTGLLGGMLRESASLLVPQAFQSSRTYTVMVKQSLDFLIHDVAGVAAQQSEQAPDAENFVARKAVGNFIDMASLATLHISPMLLLAAVSDVAYGSQVYLKELADELKAQGIIHENSTVDHVNDLLAAVSDATATTGEAFSTPPLSVDALRATIEETRAAITATNPAKVLPQAELNRMWEEIREISQREGVGMLAISGAATMHSLGKVANLGRGALSTVKVAGSLLDRHVLEHYSQAISEIRQKGLYASVAETSEPYVAAVWSNFQPRRGTLTEEIVSGRLIGKAWNKVTSWRGKSDAGANAPDEHSPGDVSPLGPPEPPAES